MTCTKESFLSSLYKENADSCYSPVNFTLRAGTYPAIVPADCKKIIARYFNFLNKSI